MITDGWLLPDKEMQFDPRFNLVECLGAFHSFLLGLQLNGKLFHVYMQEECQKKNVSIRAILPFLQMGAGLLSRKQEPNNGILRRGILLPSGSLQNGKPFETQLSSVIVEFRRYYDIADLAEPLQVKDGVVLPKSRMSYAVLAYVGEMGKPGYPDSGCFAYMRSYHQIGRFGRTHYGRKSG